MKAKTSAALFVALLFLATQFPLRAQTDCYGIQCPTQILAPCEGVYGAHVSYTVIASNLCNPSAPPSVTYSVPSGSVFPPGTNTVCAVIQIGGLPPRQCCFQVIVDNCCSSNCIDIICPKDIVAACDPATGVPGAYVFLPAPQVTNYCGDHVVPANLAVRCTPQSQPGQAIFFPPGTNTVVCCISDSAANSLKCCCFTVTVTNCPPQSSGCQPQISCPPSAQIEVSCQGPGGAVVFFPAPKISDPCGLVFATNCTHVSGSVFPNGKTTVACCIFYHDPFTGNTLTECCCFDVVVRCCQPTNCVSTLRCPTNLVVDCPPSAGLPLNYTVFGTNNCEPTSVICNPPSGSTIYGPTNVCCRLVNSSGIVLADCCFPVVINDTTAPTIDCPPDITVVSSNCQPVAVALPFVGAKDNCDPHPTVSCTPATNVFPCGVTTIDCTATDASGNTAVCSFHVTVICDNHPQIVCPPDITVNCASPTGIVVTFTAYATNGCSPTATPVTCSPASGSVFLPGTTSVCCFIDATTPGCCFKVTVIPDDIPPHIICPTNVVVTSPNCTTIDVSYPLATASDNCQLDYVRCTPPPNSPFPVGTSTVLCCAVDKAGNSNCCNFTVTVRCPSNCVQIVCPSNIVVNCAGPNGTVVSYNAYAIDNCTGAQFPVSCAPPSGSNFPLGQTQVCCTNTASPAGTLSICCFTVTVRPDTTPPTINCPSNIVVVSANCSPIIVDYPPPTATDDCQLSSVSCTPPPTFAFPVGITGVTCCAVDKAGNSNCCNFTVTVRCPSNCVTQIVCPSNVVVDCAGPNGAVVTYDAYAINSCTGNIFPVTCTRPSGSAFPPGVTTVCCTNAIAGTAPQWCCFDVTVRRDVLPPVLHCPTTNIYILCARPNGARVNYNVTATDNCDTAVGITCVPPSGSIFPIGCTNVVCTAVDSAGNASSCTFKVCVVASGCYLRNPSFELLSAPLPAPAACGDPIGLAIGWTALAGTPDLFRPPFASIAPGNCRGRERPCDGTNYAGLEGGYTASGGFTTEAMMGTLVAPLNNNARFRLRACLSLAESSPGPVLLEFVLANSANLAQQVVIHQVWVTQTNGWLQYQPPCFLVPDFGVWDRLIIRMAQVVGPNLHPYQVGYAYVDNVNICCCKPNIITVGLDPNIVTVTWDGSGQLQATGALGEPGDWHNVDSMVEIDPETGLYHTRLPRTPDNLFFRVVGPDGTLECTECGSGG